MDVSSDLTDNFGVKQDAVTESDTFRSRALQSFLTNERLSVGAWFMTAIEVASRAKVFLFVDICRNEIAEPRFLNTRVVDLCV